MYRVSARSQSIPHSTRVGDAAFSPEAHNTRRGMRRSGGLRGFGAAAMAALFVASSLGTPTSRTPAFHANIDPSLRSGEVALVHTTAGRAAALAMKLAQAGAVDVETDAAADTVIARLSGDALAAIAHDRSVTVATRDLQVVATGGGKDRPGFEKDNAKDSADKRSNGGRPSATSLASIHAPQAWQRSKGEDVTVAVMDTGIAEHPDLPKDKIRARVDFVNDGSKLQDPGGHGTFLAGVIAADGELKGVAPDADLVSLRVLDANGVGTGVGVVRAFDWLLSHRAQYRIKVLNISWGAPQTSSYQTDLLSALVESVWFSGITVVVAAGNDGPDPHTVTTPGADPFVITVGSLRDQGTADPSDDVESTFSSRGPTLDGFAKPDTLAPGEHIAGLRVKGLTYLGADGSPIGSTSDRYIHMTGTSASAASVSGIAALVLAAHPRYTPTQVKGAIVASGRPVAGSTTKAVDASAALTSMTAVNVGIAPSRLLLSLLARLHMLKGKGVTWEGVTWDGVTWDGVTWEGVTWDSVSWESVSWETVSWETVTWEGVTWGKVIQ